MNAPDPILSADHSNEVAYYAKRKSVLRGKTDLRLA